MTNEAMVTKALRRHLFSDDETSVFAVLDGASVPDLLDALYEHQPENECLYRGEIKPDIAEVAPYLVLLADDSAFTDWVLSEGWGNHWGIFAVAREELAAMRRHFRRYLIVHDPDGKPLYFRYYDPRVLRVYLPTCNAEELGTVFGPVECFLLEDEASQTALCFRINEGALVTERLPLPVTAPRET